MSFATQVHTHEHATHAPTPTHTYCCWSHHATVVDNTFPSSTQPFVFGSTIHKLWPGHRYLNSLSRAPLPPRRDQPTHCHLDSLRSQHLLLVETAPPTPTCTPSFLVCLVTQLFHLSFLFLPKKPTRFTQLLSLARITRTHAHRTDTHKMGTKGSTRRSSPFPSFLCG